MSNKGNIVGGSLNKDIIEQLEVRTQILSQTGFRDHDNILDIGTNNAWVRLSSFVEVIDPARVGKLTGNAVVASNGLSLAKDWVLKSEVRNGNVPKYGVEVGSGAYGTGGILELGYKPMPGVQSISVESQPPIGALRSATVKLKAWNLNQLSVLDMLYFRLGFTMLLEWGHSLFRNNKKELIHNAQPIDIFSNPKIRKEEVLEELSKKRKEYSNNYDGMLGVVTNYEWTQAADGSYDCTIRLASLGSVIESLKINTQTAVPSLLLNSNNPNQATQKTVDSSIEAFLLGVKQAAAEGKTGDAFVNEIKRLFSFGLDAINRLATPETDGFDPIRFEFKYGYNEQYRKNLSNIELPPEVKIQDFVNYITLNLEVVEEGGTGTPPVSENVYIPLGLLLAFINNSCTWYEGESVDRRVIGIDFNPHTNYCLRLPQQLSIDPTVCLIEPTLNSAELVKLFVKDGVSQISQIQSPTPFSNATASTVGNKIAATGISYIDADSYRGKIMNIYVNVDHILKVLTNERNNNQDTKNVYLSGFLTTLMKDVASALGNINDFKIGFDEDTLRVIIYDMQLLESPTNQAPIPELPVFGLKSAVREYSLKTEASTKLGSTLAITARAGARDLHTTGTNLDGSGFSAINTQLKDRLLINITSTPSQTFQGLPGIGNVAPQQQTFQNILNFNTGILQNGGAQPPSQLPIEAQLANSFNAHVTYIHGFDTAGSATLRYTPTNMSAVSNYYIDALLRIKNEGTESDSVTANGILPLAINIALDGIGGMPLYEAFTIPANRLPIQYLDDKGKQLIGFTVAGINHSVENNQWVTQIRGLMVNIPRGRRVTKPNYQAKKVAAPVINSGKRLAVFKGAGLEPIKALLTTVEGNYNSYNYYVADPKKPGAKKLVSVINGGNAIVTETIAQIQAKQRNKTYFAVGKYQVIPDTLSAVVKALKLSPSTVFDQQVQERVGEYLLLTARKPLGDYLTGRNAGSQSDLERAIQAAGQEWASLPIIKQKDGTTVGDIDPGTSNTTYYGGVGGNRSTSTYNVRDIAQNLIRSRIQYTAKQQNIYIPPYYIS